MEITKKIHALESHTTEFLTTKKPTYTQIDKQSQHIQLFPWKEQALYIFITRLHEMTLLDLSFQYFAKGKVGFNIHVYEIDINLNFI